MSERANFRGGGDRGGRGRGRGNDRGGRGGGNQQGTERKKENILDLAKYMDKEISVKFNGGREGVCRSCARFLSCSDLFFPSDWHFERLRSTHEPRFG